MSWTNICKRCYKYKYNVDMILPRVHVPRVHVPRVHVPRVHVPRVHVPRVHVPTVYEAKIQRKMY